MQDQKLFMSFGCLCLVLIQATSSLALDWSFSLPFSALSEKTSWSDEFLLTGQNALTRERRQAAVGTNSAGLPVHRPTFYLNNVSSPALLATLDLTQSLMSYDTSFGIHQIALLNSPTSIQDVEAALQAAWTTSNLGTAGVTADSLTVRIIAFKDYGTFSDTGLPVIDVTYVVGLNKSNAPAGTDASTMTLRVPDIGTLTGQLATKNMQLCDCDVYDGYLLHLVGINSVAPSLPAYRAAVLNAWKSTTPELNCANCTVDVQFARTVVTLGAKGERLTTAPYVILLNGKVWSPGQKRPVPSPDIMENALTAQGLPVKIYRGTDTPTYAALAFVTYLNANIQFQDLAAVQRAVQSYLNRSMPQPSLAVSIWNLEPFLNPQANVITQSSYFLTSPVTGETLDPRLFYAPPVIAVLNNQTDGNITTVTGGTLGVFPFYLLGRIQPSQLRPIAEILKITYAEANPGLNADDVEVAIVSMDDGISPQSSAPGSPTELLPVTELHVSAMVNGVDPDRIPNLTPFHLLLGDANSQGALTSRLQSFNTAVCRNCQYRKLRNLNLLQVDPTTSAIPNAQAVLDKILGSWTAANAQSAAFVPLDVSLVKRDDTLANENGTLVSQLTYSVGYPLPSFNWYIPRDPDNRTLEQQLAPIKAVPFFGEPIHPQEFVIGRQMTPQDQQVFAAAAMQAWAQDKDDLRKCLVPNANCFVAVVDPNPAVTQVNGNPQYLYKYFIMADDKVYVPSSPLSAAQQVRLRTTLDTGNAGNGGPVVVVVPGGATTAPSATPAPTVVVVPATQVGAFNLTDTINMAVTTGRQRNRVLDQLLPVWAVALQPANVTNLRITTQQDVSGFPNPQTANGLPIRSITYLLQGNSDSPIDLNAALQRFRQILPSAGIQEIFAANPDMTTPNPLFKVDFGRTNLTGPVTTTTPVTIPIIVVVPPTEVVTAAPTTTAAPVVVIQPVLARTEPVWVGPGPFTINDTIAVTADTRRARDRAMNEQVKPAWQNALGNNVTSFQLGVVRDQPFVPTQTPDGVNIRNVDYQVQGVARNRFDSEDAKQRFRSEIIAANPKNVWAMSSANGSMLTLSTLPAGTFTVATSTAATVPLATTASVVVDVVPTPTPSITSNLLAFQGSLLMKTYRPTDQDAVVQTLQQLWTQALETNDSNVLVQYLPTSTNSSVLNPDGTPQFDFRYALFTQPNGTRPDQAWPKFLALLQQSDLMEYISRLPDQAPAVSSTTQSSVPVIPVTSFTEKQDIAMRNNNEIAFVTDGLQSLWADAAGVNKSQSEVRVMALQPLDPPRVTTTNNLPVQTLTYGVTLTNASDVDAIRRRAEALLPGSPVGQYFVLPDQLLLVNQTTTTANPIVVVIIPGTPSTTTPATIIPIILGIDTVQQQPANHSIDAYVNSAVDVSNAAALLQQLWAQAYGVPASIVNLTVTNATSVNPGSDARPVTRIQYSVMVPGRPETPAVVQEFQRLLPQSQLAPLLAPEVVGPAPSRVPHSIRETASGPAELTQLTSGMHNSWVTALGQQAQPQAVSVVLTDVKPENVATASGAPISTLFYDLAVPSDVVVGPAQEAAFLQNLAQSPASQYVVWNTTTGIVPVVATTVSPAALVPFAITDNAILAVGSAPQRDRVLKQLGRVWTQALAPNTGDVALRMKSDVEYAPLPKTEAGVPLRDVSYMATGYSNGPLDETDAKLRFRQLLKSQNNITGVYLVPDLVGVVATLAPIVESTTAAVIVVIPVGTTTLEPTSTSTNATIVVVPVEVATTTVVPLVTTMQFLHLKRPVGPLDYATVQQQIAAAWAQQNNQSASNINVRILSTEPIVDADGVQGSNVTYELTAPSLLVPPESAVTAATLGAAGWPVCEGCFAVPVRSFYLATDPQNPAPAPLVLRDDLRQAVILANQDVPSNTIQTAFPQNAAPVVSNDISATGQDLVKVNYFAVGKGDDQKLFQLREPTIPQVASQVGSAGQSQGEIVYPVGSPQVVKPIRLLLQDGGSWSDGTTQALDNATIQAAQTAVNNAIAGAATNHSLNCAGSQLVKNKDLYGLFGKQYSQLIYTVNSPNGSCTYLPDDIINEIQTNAQAGFSNNPAPAIQAQAPLLQATVPIQPDHVLYYDYPGKLNIFDLQARKAELATNWLAANPDCVKISCNYSSQILATQRRLASDGSDITRAYYTIRSTWPYAVYPAQPASTSALTSRPIQKLSLLPGSQSNQQLQEVLRGGTPTRRRRQTVDQVSQIQDVNSRYCYDAKNDRYIPYTVVDVLPTTDTTATSNDRVVLKSGAVMPSWNASTDCPGCVCDIPVFLALLPGRVEATTPDDRANLANKLLQPWLVRYANVSSELYNVAPSQWKSFILGDPDYKFHDANGSPLTLVRYGVQAAGAPPSSLQAPDLNRNDLAAGAPNLTCVDNCAPQLNQAVYLANAPQNAINANTSALLAPALTQLWRTRNPSIPDLVVDGVVPTNDGQIYGLTSGGTPVGNLQRTDYVVGMQPATNWTSLETMQVPSADSISGVFQNILGSPNISVYPANLVRSVPTLQKTDFRTAYPNWLPAAIIIPLAGVIAMTLILVCLITRASRLFRTKKTVVITDPSMIQNIGAESPFKDGNGKATLNYDDYHNVGGTGVSKV